MYPLSSYIVFIEGAIGLVFGFYAAVTVHGSQFTSNGTGVSTIAGAKALGIGVASLGYDISLFIFQSFGFLEPPLVV